MSGVELTEFVLARISDDEDAALAATPGPWRWDAEFGDKGDTGLTLTNDAGAEIIENYVTHCCQYRDDVSVEDVDAAHIARHDPARVLAECAAKRALVVMCQPDPIDAQLRALATTNPAAWNLVGPLVEQADKDRSVTLRLLSLPYADHPDYREEWRP